MMEKKEKIRKYGWRSYFARFMGMAMVCFSILAKATIALGFVAVPIAGAMVFSACEKNTSNEPRQEEPHYNVTIKINGSAGTHSDDTTGYKYRMREGIMTPLQSNSAVDTIFIVPYGDWGWIRGPNSANIVNGLRNCLNFI